MKRRDGFAAAGARSAGNAASASASASVRNSPGIVVMRGMGRPIGPLLPVLGSFARAVAGFKGTLAHRGATLLPCRFLPLRWRLHFSCSEQSLDAFALDAFAERHDYPTDDKGELVEVEIEGHDKSIPPWVVNVDSVT